MIGLMAEARPNLMRRRLGLALRVLRQRSGLTLGEAAKKIGVSLPTLSRVELGKQRVTSATLDKYLAAYEVPESKIAEIRKLAGLASSGRRGNLLNQYSDAIDDLFAGYLELEEVATRADIYTVQVIPGLLQTEEYAHALIAAGIMWRTERQVRTFAELRVARQRVLRGGDPLAVWCIVEEAALRRPVGGRDVHRRQLKAIRDRVDELPHLHLQVMPMATGEHCGVDGQFTMFRFDAGDPIVAVESMTRVLYLEEDHDVGQYETAFNYLRATALDPVRSREFIGAMIDQEG